MRLQITDKGREIIARSVAEEKAIVFSKMMVGCGTYATTSTTALTDYVDDFEIESAERDGENVTLSGTFSNGDVETAFRMTELGITASVYGDNAEYLFAYGFVSESDADLIPSISDTALTAVFNAVVTIGSSATVTIVISEDLYAKKADLTNHITNTQNPHGVTKAQIGLGNVPNLAPTNMTVTFTPDSSPSNITSGSTLGTLFKKTAGAISSLISHLAARNNPHQVTLNQMMPVSASDNGKVLQVAGGIWTKTALPDVFYAYGTITTTASGNTTSHSFSCDRTPLEIYNAASNGKTVIVLVKFNYGAASGVYFLIPTAVRFGVGQGIPFMSLEGSVYENPKFISFSVTANSPVTSTWAQVTVYEKTL